MSFSETELISEIKNRNEEAYRFMIKEYSKVMYYLAWRILQNVCTKEDLEECVSDVFLEIWLKIDAFDQERGNFKTWILILTKYKALKYRRKYSKQDVVNIDDYAILSSESTEQTVLTREDQIKVMQTIQSFRSIDRELFVRKYFYGETIQFLMASFNLSRSAIDNRLFRGRKVIKEALCHD